MKLPLAAEQFEICRKLKPQLPELLLILARVWGELNRVEESRAALLIFRLFRGILQRVTKYLEHDRVTTGSARKQN